MAQAWCHCSCSSYLSLKKKASAASASHKARKSRYAGQSIKPIPIRVLTVGKKRSKGTQLLVEEYTQKIKFYCNIEDTLIKSNPKATSDVRSQIEAEDMVMMQHITPDDFIVMMDENGKDIVSEEMADLIGDAANKKNMSPPPIYIDDIVENRLSLWGISPFLWKMGSLRLTFCIGGPYGHGPLVRERADMAISLSSLVLNHQIALIVLLEQIYRAWTIIKGQKYHH